MFRAVYVSNMDGVAPVFTKLFEEYTTAKFQWVDVYKASAIQFLPRKDASKTPYIELRLKNDVPLNTIVEHVVANMSKLDTEEKNALLRYLQPQTTNASGVKPVPIILDGPIMPGVLSVVVDWKDLHSAMLQELETSAFNISKYEALWANRKSKGDQNPLDYLRSVEEETVNDADSATVIRLMMEAEDGWEYALPVMAALLPRYDGDNILEAFRKAVRAADKKSSVKQ